MTEQAQHARAARAGLGGHRAFYPGARESGDSGAYFPIAAVVLGATAVVLVAAGMGAVAVIPLALLALAVFGRLLERSTSKRNEGMRLDLYEHGLTVARDGRAQAVRYDTTAIYQDNVRYTYGKALFAYTLVDVDGEKVVLRGRTDEPGDVAERGRFSNPREWGPAIQQAVTDVQLPRAMATLNTGGRLTFGDVWMTAREVGSATESARWAEIEEIDGRAGVFQLKVAGRRRALTSMAVSAIPNYFVFLTLAVYLRESSRRTVG